MNEPNVLLSVEDHFLIDGRGLVLVPVVDQPRTGKFKPFSEKLIVRRPGWEREGLLVRFLIKHLYRSGGGEWHIVSIAPDGTKTSIPRGSKVLADETIRRRLEGIAATD